MEPGDILGHEFMGEVVEVGRGVKNLKVGDRVVVPFPIACGNCGACKAEAYSLCENSQPQRVRSPRRCWGITASGIFGYSHLTGGFAGGQAEYARVPFADVGPLKVPEGLTDEQVLFLSDILPTGYMGAEMCDIKPGDTVAVWGCGPVGQFAIASAYLLGAERVIAIDRFQYRLDMAREKAGAITINYEEVDSVPDALKELTGGRGPDHCIDAVGMEGHTHGIAVRVRPHEADDAHGDRPADRAARGDHGVPQRRHGLGDRRLRGLHRQVPDGRGHEPVAHDQDRPVPRAPLHEAAARAHPEGRDRPDVRHHAPHAARAGAPKGYKIFNNKQDNCEKIVLKA